MIRKREKFEPVPNFWVEFSEQYKEKYGKANGYYGYGYLVSRSGRVIRVAPPEKTFMQKNHIISSPVKYIRGSYSPAMGITIQLEKPNGEFTTVRLANIVATVFVPNPENYTAINFKDGDKTNCNADNLEWVRLSDSQKQQYDKISNQINVYDASGRYMRTFRNIEEAMAENYGKSRPCITKACNYPTITHNGYYWRLVADSPAGVDLKLVRKKATVKKILQLDTDGNVLNKFDSLKEAKEFFEKEHHEKINESNIYNCCIGKRKKCKGYKWQFSTEVVDVSVPVDSESEKFVTEIRSIKKVRINVYSTEGRYVATFKSVLETTRSGYGKQRDKVKDSCINGSFHNGYLFRIESEEYPAGADLDIENGEELVKSEVVKADANGKINRRYTSEESQNIIDFFSKNLKPLPEIKDAETKITNIDTTNRHKWGLIGKYKDSTRFYHIYDANGNFVKTVDSRKLSLSDNTGDKTLGNVVIVTSDSKSKAPKAIKVKKKNEVEGYIVAEFNSKGNIVKNYKSDDILDFFENVLKISLPKENIDEHSNAGFYVAKHSIYKNVAKTAKISASQPNAENIISVFDNRGQFVVQYCSVDELCNSSFGKMIHANKDMIEKAACHKMPYNGYYWRKGRNAINEGVSINFNKWYELCDADKTLIDIVTDKRDTAKLQKVMKLLHIESNDSFAFKFVTEKKVAYTANSSLGADYIDVPNVRKRYIAYDLNGNLREVFDTFKAARAAGYIKRNDEIYKSCKERIPSNDIFWKIGITDERLNKKISVNKLEFDDIHIAVVDEKNNAETLCDASDNEYIVKTVKDVFGIDIESYAVSNRELLIKVVKPKIKDN